jgi:hypothetical protein
MRNLSFIILTTSLFILSPSCNQPNSGALEITDDVVVFGDEVDDVSLPPSDFYLPDGQFVELSAMEERFKIEHGGGDCEGVAREYFSGNTTWALDTVNCYDYGIKVTIYQWSGDSLKNVFSSDVSADMSHMGDGLPYVRADEILSFSHMEIYRQSRTRRQVDLNMDPIDNVEATNDTIILMDMRDDESGSLYTQKIDEYRAIFKSKD